MAVGSAWMFCVTSFLSPIHLNLLLLLLLFFALSLLFHISHGSIPPAFLLPLPGIPPRRPMSTNVNGFYDIDQDCFLSLPCVVGRHGVQAVIPVDLKGDELPAFRKSAKELIELQNTVQEKF